MEIGRQSRTAGIADDRRTTTGQTGTPGKHTLTEALLQPRRATAGGGLAESAPAVEADAAALPDPGVSQPPMLAIGSSGPWVRTLQMLLSGSGDPLEVDGAFGKNTRAAVVRHQTSSNLEADGVVGPLTWGSLLGVQFAATGGSTAASAGSVPSATGASPPARSV